MTMQAERLLTPTEAARLAGCHRNWIGRLTRRGVLPSISTGYGPLYWPADVLSLGRKIADRRANANAKKQTQAAEHATPMPAGDAG